MTKPPQNIAESLPFSTLNFFTQRHVAAMLDDDDAVQVDRAATLAQVPLAHEVVVGRVAGHKKGQSLLT